jgi:hypothetical protein
MVVSDHQSSEAADPCEGSFHFVPFSVSFTHALALPPLVLSVLSVGREERNTTLSQPSSQGVTIVSFVRNQPFRSRFWAASSSDFDLFEGFLDKRDFCGRGRVDMASKWNTLTVDHHHPLRSFAPLGFSDSSAPFFAGAKLPSINASSQSRICFSSRSAKNNRQISSQRPSSSQRRRRLRQVLPLGSSAGTSFQRAPVFKTQRMPSSTSRFSAGGRPFLRFSGVFGSNGSILDHCSSVKSRACFLIGSPPKRLIHKITLMYKDLCDNRAISHT